MKTSRLWQSLAVSFALAACSPAAQPSDAGDASARDAPSDAPSPRPHCTSTPPAYPPGPYAIEGGGILPDLSFVRADGTALALHTLFTPCAERPSLLVIRSLAAWSGPARWHAEHTTRWLADHQDRVQMIDLLVLGQDNLPAVREDLAPWSSRYDVAPAVLAADPDYTFRPLYLAVRQLPLVVMVDPRTMRVMSILFAPPLDAARYAIEVNLARLDGAPRPPAPDPVLYDNRFSEDQWDMIRAMSPVPAPPPDPTNAVADDPRAIAWGETLFRDADLSPARVACAQCHDPSRAFTDGRAVGFGISAGTRNTPSARLAAHARWQFWDGRADTLWSQALGPMENPTEMGSSRLRVAHRIAAQYAQEYTALFGPLPPLNDTARFPVEGMPGAPAWEGMTPADQRAINRVFSNAGKAIAAFERTLTVRESAFDRYAQGTLTALTPSARDGLKLFFQNGCAQCHHGPLFTDQSFHNIAMPTGRADGTPDPGRADAIASLRMSTFTAASEFSDAPAPFVIPMRTDAMVGQFRTPPLRGVMETGPWGHGGTFASMDDVIVHYAQRGHGHPVAGSVGMEDLHLGGFHEDAATVQPLVSFLRTLSAQ